VNVIVSTDYVQVASPGAQERLSKLWTSAWRTDLLIRRGRRGTQRTILSLRPLGKPLRPLR